MLFKERRAVLRRVSPQRETCDPVSQIHTHTERWANTHYVHQPLQADNNHWHAPKGKHELMCGETWQMQTLPYKAQRATEWFFRHQFMGDFGLMCSAAPTSLKYPSGRVHLWRFVMLLWWFIVVQHLTLTFMSDFPSICQPADTYTLFHIQTDANERNFPPSSL